MWCRRKPDKYALGTKFAQMSLQNPSSSGRVKIGRRKRGRELSFGKNVKGNRNGGGAKRPSLKEISRIDGEKNTKYGEEKRKERREGKDFCPASPLGALDCRETSIVGTYRGNHKKEGKGIRGKD